MSSRLPLSPLTAAEKRRRHNAAQLAYYQANTAKVLLAQRAYRARVRAQRQAYQAHYYQTHKQRIKEQRAAGKSETRGGARGKTRGHGDGDEDTLRPSSLTTDHVLLSPLTTAEEGAG